MKTLITLCARGGSKGIPGKNIKKIGELPLIYYSADIARRFKEKMAETDIVLSTDSDEIRNVVADFGLGIDTTYQRPEALATDQAGKIGVIQDVLLHQEAKTGFGYDMVLDLDITSPLRNLDDLLAALNLINNSQEAYNIFSVSPANRNPYFNMVEEKPDGYVALCKQGQFLSRQQAPRVFDLNASFYYYRRSFFEQGFKTVFTDKTLIYEVPHICFDLDHPIDFEFMSYLIQSGKLDFEF